MKKLLILVMLLFVGSVQAMQGDGMPSFTSLMFDDQNVDLDNLPSFADPLSVNYGSGNLNAESGRAATLSNPHDNRNDGNGSSVTPLAASSMFDDADLNNGDKTDLMGLCDDLASAVCKNDKIAVAALVKKLQESVPSVDRKISFYVDIAFQEARARDYQKIAKIIREGYSNRGYNADAKSVIEECRTGRYVNILSIFLWRTFCYKNLNVGQKRTLQYGEYVLSELTGV